MITSRPNLRLSLIFSLAGALAIFSFGLQSRAADPDVSASLASTIGDVAHNTSSVEVQPACQSQLAVGLHDGGKTPESITNSIKKGTAAAVQ